VATRQQLASLVGAAPGELALTGSTTLGVNIGVWGLEWRPGDEVVTTSIEHRGVLAPLAQVAARRGAVVRTADVGDGGAALEPIAAQLNNKTRLVAVRTCRSALARVCRFASLPKPPMPLAQPCW
jgi:L-cysteine/cystine lyase